MPITERQCYDMCYIICDWYLYHKQQPYLAGKIHRLGMAKEVLKYLIDKFVFHEIQYHDSPKLNFEDSFEDGFEIHNYMHYWVIRDQIKWKSDIKKNIKSIIEYWETTWAEKLVIDQPDFPDIKIMTDDLKNRLIEYLNNKKEL